LWPISSQLPTNFDFFAQLKWDYQLQTVVQEHQHIKAKYDQWSASKASTGYDIDISQ